MVKARFLINEQNPGKHPVRCLPGFYSLNNYKLKSRTGPLGTTPVGLIVLWLR